MTFHFAVPTSGRASLTLFDPAGRRAVTILEDQWTVAGPQDITLTTTSLHAGLYFARLQFDEQEEIQKVVVSR